MNYVQSYEFYLLFGLNTLCRIGSIYFFSTFKDSHSQFFHALRNLKFIYIYIYIYIKQFHEEEAFMTLKDHKDIFPNFRLINPSKSEVGKISKSILDKINNVLFEKAKVNQYN